MVNTVVDLPVDIRAVYKPTRTLTSWLYLRVRDGDRESGTVMLHQQMFFNAFFFSSKTHFIFSKNETNIYTCSDKCLAVHHHSWGSFNFELGKEFN